MCGRGKVDLSREKEELKAEWVGRVYDHIWWPHQNICLLEGMEGCFAERILGREGVLIRFHGKVYYKT